MRKTPIRHRVRHHTRKTRPVREYQRGYSQKQVVIKRHMSREMKRQRWIKRVVNDVDMLMSAYNKAIKEINPKWGIEKWEIHPGTSLDRYLKGEKNVFRTPFGGISGAELRGEHIPTGYLSDVDLYIYFTPGTDIWYGGNLSMLAENKITENPSKYLRRHRDFRCIDMKGRRIKSKYCNDPLRLPLDEPDLRKTHEIVEHMKK